MENYIAIKAESRNGSGKQYAKKIRHEGKIPAIIYGQEKESIPVIIQTDELKKVLKSESGENTLLKIHRDDVVFDAMLKEVQYDYLSNNIIHADFIRIDVTKSVTVPVPIEVVGEPVGVKVEGGVFDFVTREVKISCLASKIPNKIELDISELHSGVSIKADSLKLPEGIKLISETKTVICLVHGKEAEVVAAEEEAPAETPETEGKETAPEEEEKKKPEKPH